MDCGPACLRMVAKYYGRHYALEFLRERSFLTRQGVSLLGISDAAESIGLRALAVRMTPNALTSDTRLPCIVHWRQNHFIVVYRVRKDRVYVADPGHGLLTYSRDEFMRGWASGDREEGIALLLEPTPDFYASPFEEHPRPGIRFILTYLGPYRSMLVQLLVGMLLGSLLQLVFPFLTQSLVDFAITNRNLEFVYTVLLSQLMLFISRTTVDLIRSRILLHVGARINISIISDFLLKLTKLPLSFFDTKLTGDLLQRISDHRRISGFLTGSTLGILFSLFNFVIFGVVLSIYSLKVMGVFLAGSAVVVFWVLAFTRRRKELDYKRFAQMAENQGHLIQLVQGMAEIKLYSAERQKRWDWERVQTRLFALDMAGLSIAQYQQGGMLFLNELKNIIISILSARLVIDGDMTLGMMMAVSYIVGQLNAPIEQLMSFVDSAQDAKISLDRLVEIHDKSDEEDTARDGGEVQPRCGDLRISGLSFQYEGPHSELVLKDLDLVIPQGRMTALVGASGSGKTTLLKLLLRFYDLTHGEIRLAGSNLAGIRAGWWRAQCGVVMQDGFIFSDSIARNITLGNDRVDPERLYQAVNVANVREFVESLPLGYNTKIGADGHGLSQGQKQRILIARAVYKNPTYLFFDEATSALDASNERSIMEKLGEFFSGRTVLVVAHRLSTVRNAHQIVVLEKGRIIETGTHDELVRKRTAYFHLVKDQLELGE